MDGAGWHRSKNLNIPNTIKVEYLSAYYPEFNPVERFWNISKDTRSVNKIHPTLSSLQDDVTGCLNAMQEDLIRCLCAALFVGLNMVLGVTSACFKLRTTSVFSKPFYCLSSSFNELMLRSYECN